MYFREYDDKLTLLALPMCNTQWHFIEMPFCWDMMSSVVVACRGLSICIHKYKHIYVTIHISIYLSFLDMYLYILL